MHRLQQLDRTVVDMMHAIPLHVILISYNKHVHVHIGFGAADRYIAQSYKHRQLLALLRTMSCLQPCIHAPLIRHVCISRRPPS